MFCVIFLDYFSWLFSFRAGWPNLFCHELRGNCYAHIKHSILYQISEFLIHSDPYLSKTIFSFKCQIREFSVRCCSEWRQWGAGVDIVHIFNIKIMFWLDLDRTPIKWSITICIREPCNSNDTTDAHVHRQWDCLLLFLFKNVTKSLYFFGSESRPPLLGIKRVKFLHSSVRWWNEAMLVKKHQKMVQHHN